jgi:hypothetical protein
MVHVRRALHSLQAVAPVQNVDAVLSAGAVLSVNVVQNADVEQVVYVAAKENIQNNYYILLIKHGWNFSKIKSKKKSSLTVVNN